MELLVEGSPTRGNSGLHRRERENLAGGGVNAAEGGVAGVKRGDGFGLGIDARCDANGGRAGRVDGWPDAGADGGEKCCTEGRAFFGFDDFDGLAKDVGLNLTP